MAYFNNQLFELVQRDGRYMYEAFEFLFQALNYTQEMLQRKPPEGRLEEAEEGAYHVSGRELLQGVRELALREFGLMAPVVFRMWGIRKTDDFGEMVFALIDAGLMSKTEQDARTDFHDLYHLDDSLIDGYEIGLNEAFFMDEAK